MIYKIGMIVGGLVALACAVVLTLASLDQPASPGTLAPASAPAAFTGSAK